MKKTTLLAAIAAIGLGLGIAGDALAQQPTTAQQPAPGQRRHMERHPEIRKALRAMENAKRFLQQGAHDFGGHRAKSLQLIDQAIAEANLALKADKN